ncbi:MAG TPA: Arm DNA-binding domain-containing protein, partial [Stellaceae bacterium]|nr:Arm DNA-binding domain-containing protein [Stellaceae bacterium]
MAKTRRTQVNLTDLKIKSLKPDPAGEYVQGDTQVPGFGVRVRSHGTATYIVMKRLPGATSPLRMTLGRVPLCYPPAPGEIGLAEAREKARQAIAAVRSGVDVNREKRRARAAVSRRREARAETGFEPDSFGAIANHYIA